VENETPKPHTSRAAPGMAMGLRMPSAPGRPHPGSWTARRRPALGYHLRHIAQIRGLNRLSNRRDPGAGSEDSVASVALLPLSGDER
jgi:hypothetical protein